MATKTKATKAKKEDYEKRVTITPKFRVSYPSVITPRAFDDEDAKYSVTMLFPKNTDIATLKTAAMNAALEFWGTKAKFPQNMRWPFRDGDKQQDKEGYAGNVVVKAGSKFQPGVVNARRESIIAEGELYSGCYARAQVVAQAYSTAGNSGVTFYLLHVQKLEEGDRLDGRKKAEDVFTDYNDGSEDVENYEEETVESDMGF